MTAGNTEHPENTGRPENTGCGPEYDGMDAVMAAILDEPLPARALRDPVFMAAHGAAAADVAVLREQLGLIGDALATSAAGAEDLADAARLDPAAVTEAGGGVTGGEAAPAAEADASAADEDDPAGRGAGNDDPVGQGATAGRRGPASAGDRRPEAGGGPRHGAGPRTGAGAGSPSGAGAAGPAATPSSVTPLAPPMPLAPHLAGAARRTRRPRTVALGVLAAAVAATVVAGMGWLVAQPKGSSDDRGGTAASDSAAGEKGGGVLFGSPRYLACARFVAEGTVSAVEPTPSGETEHITLTVTRYYKTDDGKGDGKDDKDGKDDQTERIPVRVAEQPALHVGDLVLVGVPLGDTFPDMVIVGERNIAPERARLTGSLPEARRLTCR